MSGSSHFAANRNALFAKGSDKPKAGGAAAAAAPSRGLVSSLESPVLIDRCARSQSTTTHTQKGSHGGPNSTFTTPAASGASRSTFGVGSPTGGSASGSSGGGGGRPPKRMNLEKLKEAEEYRIKAQKMLKVKGGRKGEGSLSM